MLEKLISKEKKISETWQNYSENEYVGTYIELPRFIRIFRGKFQQIFGRRVYSCYNFSMTIGELIFFLGSLGILGVNIGVSFTHNQPSGNAASIPFLFCLAFTAKNSLLSFLCGISYERGLFWHKIYGILTVGAGILHLLSSPKMIDGWFLFGGAASMVVFSFWPIRKYFYDLFLRLHWIGLIFIIVGSIWHGATLPMIGLGYWALDFIIKSIVVYRHSNNCSEIEISRLNQSVVQLTVLNNKIPFSAGQYVFVCIPKLSYLQWHPFSIASSFGEGKIDIFAKVSGGWTRDLMALTEANPVKIKAYLSGPYGYPSLDIACDYYKSFILIGGGLGVTPIVSLFKQLLEEKQRGRPINKIFFIWTTRDTTGFKDMLSDNYIQSMLTDKENPLGFCETFYHSAHDSHKKHPTKNTIFLDARANIKSYFKKMKSQAEKRKERQIAVLVCGPAKLIQNVQHEARQQSKGNVRFDVHEEVFLF